MRQDKGKISKVWRLRDEDTFYMQTLSVDSLLNPASYIIKHLIFLFGFYAKSTVFLFLVFDGDGSQIHFSWTCFDQHLTSPLSRHWHASRSAIPIILSAKGGGGGEVTTTSFKDFGLSRPGIEPTTSCLRDGRCNH